MSLDYLWVGFAVALQPTNLLYALAGCFLGTIIGALPAIGPINGIALILPIAYTLKIPAESCMILLAAIYYGSEYGGRISSILINVPGDAVSKASVNLRIGSEASAVALLPSSGRCVVEVGRVSCSVSVPSRCAVPASSCVGCVCAAEVCKWAAVAAGGVVPSVTVCQPVPCDSSGRVVAAIHPAE